MGRLARFAVWCFLASTVAGCASGRPDDFAAGDDLFTPAASGELRVAGSWVPDAAALRAGSAVVAYDDVPAWDGGAHCTGGPTRGASDLSRHLRASFPGISSIGGYSCRPNTANTAKMSVHGSGRALDIMIPLDHGDADNGVGDRIANWLIANSTTIGVQYLAWDRTQWSGSRRTDRVRPYTGPNPHIDHIHVEITLRASRRETPFFGGGATTSPDPTPPPPPALTLAAGFVGQGSDAAPDTSGVAQFAACPGDAVTVWFEVENTGTAPWVDAGDTGAGHVGRAVRLGVPTDTADPFTGIARLSLSASSNPMVTPGEAACFETGCRRTRFTLEGHVPASPGIHRTVWRLVDETRAWFGPEMWLSFHVLPCDVPTPPASTAGDDDLDGSDLVADCDDHDGARFPGAVEICSDGVDQDCDGIDTACFTPSWPTPHPDVDDPGFDWAGGEEVHTPTRRRVPIQAMGCSASPAGARGPGLPILLVALVAFLRRRAR